MPESHSRPNQAEATILVKAFPQVGELHGETVCVAAVDAYRKWLRLYPIAFRQLGDEQRFTRWERINFTWRAPKANRDNRPESRNVNQDSIATVGKLRPEARAAFLAPIIVESTKRERADGRSLALIRPEQPEFSYKPRSQAEMNERRASYARLLASPDMFGAKNVIPLEPAPYEFYYRYRDADGNHECRCHDWEIEQTYLNFSRRYGEQRALNEMMALFGNRYPTEGMLLAMGTHSRYPDVWMIIGVLKVPNSSEPPLL